MAATPSMVVVKEFSYRGQTQRFSNRYHFSGGTPADNAAWNTLFDAVVDAEKLCFGAGVTIVECKGYAAGATVATHSKTYSDAGTITVVGYKTPGDVAALVRYATAARSAKGRPVYLYNYYHGIHHDISDADELASNEATAFGVYANKWWNIGFSDGTNTVKRAGPNGADATGHHVGDWLTHRDFPR